MRIFRTLNAQAWLIFGLLTACYGLASFFRTSPSTLAVDIMRDFSVGGGLMAVMSSAFFYPYAVMQIPAGILSDRWGPRSTICLFLLIGAAGALIFAGAHSVGMAALGRMLVGTGMAMVFVPALRVILFWFPPRRHALGTGLLLSLGTGGMLLATWPLMMLSQFIGWRGSMLAAAALTVLMAAVVWRVVRNRPQEKGFTPPWSSPDGTADKASVPPLKRTMLGIMKTRTYWTVSIWFFCMYGSFFSLSGLWAGPYFIQGYGLDKSAAGGVLFCLALGSTLGPTLIGFLSPWLRLPKTWLLLIACAATMALACPLLLPRPVIPPLFLPVWGVTFGVFCGGFGGIALTRIQDDFPPEIVGTATGMINIYTYLGSALLQLASGWIMELQAPGQGAYALPQYTSMFTLFMVMFCCAFAASLFALREPKAEKENPVGLRSGAQ